VRPEAARRRQPGRPVPASTTSCTFCPEWAEHEFGTGEAPVRAAS